MRTELGLVVRGAVVVWIAAVVGGCRAAPSVEAGPADVSPSARTVVRPAAAAARVDPGPHEGDHYPLRYARERGDRIDNREAPIPIQCYTKTEGVSNPCWACHTQGTYPNLVFDADLQRQYAFSEYGQTNRWRNAFVDRSEAIAAIDDDEVLAWIRQDNYDATRRVLAGRMPPWAYGWDLDLRAGFDDEGFARDGTGWRAFRYKPFLGTFWPTNGSSDDVMIRLEAAFRQRDGEPSLAVYKANLALLEASMASDPAVADADVWWPTEPLDEIALGVDLDGDGELSSRAESIVGLPATYVGDASDHPLRRGTYPAGTELLHSVRYLDPDAPGWLSARLKELRYLAKEEELGRGLYFARYEQEAEDKDAGVLPRYRGSAETGLVNAYGWRVQGYIEDAQGRLRLQSHEEHYACMGCHSGIGVTADGTFALARKVPGRAGWGHQRLDSIPDVPQVGHEDPEALTYLRRVGGGDELRANGEMLARWFIDGTLDEAKVRRAAPGGEGTLADLVLPSRARALALDKAYLALVRSGEGFEGGRDAPLAPTTRVHTTITETETGLAASGKVHVDGTLRLDWSGTSWWAGAPARPPSRRTSDTQPGPAASSPRPDTSRSVLVD